MERYKEDGSLNDLAHKEDHHFIDSLRGKRDKFEETKQKIKISVISSLLIAMTIGFASFIYNIVIEILRGNR